MADKIKIHLGCGKRDFGKDWIHIDSVQMPHILLHDVTQLPFKTSSVSLIYASHLIAYFDREEIIPVLKEWRRVLVKGGILRLATPDWDVLRKIAVPMLGPLYGKMGNPVIYHKTVYSKESLCTLLMNIGFKKCRRYDHTKTDHPYNPDRNHYLNDCSGAASNGKLISLNIECEA